jgi:eukaryotic-like serine/threonine-protein kinase
VTGWKSGRVEEWKSGRVEGWKGGRVEGWKSKNIFGIMIKFKVIAVCLPVLLIIGCKNRINEESAFFRSDANHSGFYDTPGLDRLHGTRWSFRTNGRVFSSPVICEKTVFIGSEDSSFYALNAQDGKLIWKFRTGGRVSSSAAIYDDKVYFVSFDGYLYCLDKDTGKELWKFKSAGERVFAAPGIHGLPEKDRPLDDPWDMFLSSPVAANGKVYFGSGAGIFYALDCNTGSEKWEFRTNGVIHSSPAYADSMVYFGSWDSYLYALNSASGTLKWKFKTGTDTLYFNQTGFQSSPVVFKNVVYSGCRDAYIWAIDAKTGALKWKYYNNGSWVIATPAVHNDTLYFTTSDTHKLIALNASDGRELYSNSCKTFGFSSPGISVGNIYTGNFGGSMMAFEKKSGKILWEFLTPAAKANKDSILASNGEFILGKVFKENSYTGMLKAMDVLYSTGSILSSPAVSNGMVYFGSADGSVYALY